MQRATLRRIAVSASPSSDRDRNPVQRRRGQGAATRPSDECGFQAVDEAFREQREYTEFCFARLEQRMDAGFAKVDDRLALLGAGLSRVERKLDQFIDVQTRTNDLVERRLRAVE